MSGDATPQPPPIGGRERLRRLAALVRDVARFAGPRRLVSTIMLMGATAFAEGAGLLLLLPLLDLLGISGSGRVSGWLGAMGLPPVGLGGALALYVVLMAVASLVVRARTLTVLRLRLAYVDDLRRRLHDAILATEWPVFSRLRSAALSQALTEECVKAGIGVEFLLRLGTNGLQIATLLAAAAWVSPPLAGLLLGLAAVAGLTMRPMNRLTYRLGQMLQEAGRRMNADLLDDLAGMRVVRSHGLEAARRRRFAERIAQVRDSHLAYMSLAGTEQALTRTAAAAVTAGVVLTAVQGLDMPLADTLAVIVAFARLLSTGMALRQGQTMILHALPAHAAVGDLLRQLREGAEPVAAGKAPPFERSLRVEGVCYRHGSGETPALNDVTAEIPARGITAVIGPSGSGKSTLADLLLGLITPESGRILADGRPLEGSDRLAWRQRVAYVPQDSFLFHDTVRNNLAMVRPDASDAELWDALERAAAADFLRAQPSGLDTVVGDRGGWLSGGERQRIAIARALLRRPALLILDEATSALDAESERRILSVIEALGRDMAVLVVTHRPATARCADRLLVMEGGRLVAAGRWEEVEARSAPLLARLGLLATAA
ncbi:ABC transporter ATP-binding protein [Azospirillum thermophilum]|nr:ABC transporter ATP-binding protein [Azospirillum thermophilum]